LPDLKKKLLEDKSNILHLEEWTFRHFVALEPNQDPSFLAFEKQPAFYPF
jgi:hypothetical protein